MIKTWVAVSDSSSRQDPTTSPNEALFIIPVSWSYSAFCFNSSIAPETGVYILFNTMLPVTTTNKASTRVATNEYNFKLPTSLNISDSLMYDTTLQPFEQCATDITYPSEFV